MNNHVASLNLPRGYQEERWGSDSRMTLLLHNVEDLGEDMMNAGEVNTEKRK